MARVASNPVSLPEGVEVNYQWQQRFCEGWQRDNGNDVDGRHRHRCQRRRCADYL